ncbi:MAG TPA: bifunctional phosphopantothenoylcysteine decarboxylase/phosphopantothenate--cysteine ligase CoaBC [Polyangiaceae bacterium]|nr:bifunctional phosphopantothenoylcysteine decarboxylase/phosphopantothenate--cysteine ligase CoaBC [Polyangiaceae bacterium]
MVDAPAPLTVGSPARLSNKRIVLCVTGSVAAYKAALLLRLLRREGADVTVVLSARATEFVGAATFAALSGKPVLTDMFAPAGGEVHVDLAAASDLVLIVPATADVLSRLATGRADDLTAALALSAGSVPVLVAPAMHPHMWAHPAVQRNVERLTQDDRVEIVGPVEGEVASGDVGMGRMVEPEVVLSHVVARLSQGKLRGRHLVVTAGPTVEDIDPVRFIGNRSSGKMGFAVAERAAARGARVTLIAGPCSLTTPLGVTRVDVRSAVAMRGAVWQALGLDLANADALVMAAAVGDYRPAELHATKLKRNEDNMSIELRPNPDILAEVGHARRGQHPVLIGFAVEADTDEAMINYARRKLDAKRVDLVVANLADDSFGRDDDRATLVAQDHIEPLDTMAKAALAERLLDWLDRRFSELK